MEMLFLIMGYGVLMVFADLYLMKVGYYFSIKLNKKNDMSR